MRIRPSTEIVATVGREALRPLARCSVAATREAAGIRIAWMRRTRLDGDGWEAVDVPLGEDAESYEIDILKDGGVVRRRSRAREPSLLYAAAQELADFGAPQSALSFRVVQISAVAGRGFERRVTFPVR